MDVVILAADFTRRESAMRIVHLMHRKDHRIVVLLFTYAMHVRTVIVLVQAVIFIADIYVGNIMLGEVHAVFLASSVPVQVVTFAQGNLALPRRRIIIYVSSVLICLLPLELNNGVNPIDSFGHGQLTKSSIIGWI